PEPVHGRASVIVNDGSDMFANLPRTIRGGRYHSLVTEAGAAKLALSARVMDEGTVMGLRHRHSPVRGLQFHPESVLTPQGAALMKNFFAIADEWNVRELEAA